MIVSVKASHALGTGDVALNTTGTSGNAELQFDGAAVSAGGRAIHNVTAGVASTVWFDNGASAGTARITNSNTGGHTSDTVFGKPNHRDVLLAGTYATAANASIDNNVGGTTTFLGVSTAGNASLTNRAGGTTWIGNSANGGQATLTNEAGGGTYFHGQGKADTATVINQAGGVVDISTTYTGTSIGSLSGAGNVLLGARQLTLGNLNRNENIGGIIADGGHTPGAGGQLIKTGTGALTLSGANSYTGTTKVAIGTLAAGAVNSLSAASAHAVVSGATLDLSGHDQSVAGLNNAGTVRLSPVGTAITTGTHLTVTGALVGNGGAVILGSQLGNSSSPTDQIVLSGAGAKASGTTRLAVENRGGLGAQTAGAGIPVVVAQGARLRRKTPSP